MPRQQPSAPSRRPIRVLTVIGTRPDVIKLAPVICALRGRPTFEERVVLSAQHRDLVAEPLALFGISVDHDLDLMRVDQTLSMLAGRLLQELDGLLVDADPDWVLVQGDTTTALAAGLAAVHRRIRVGHVEAGLRTHRADAPFPEETNRRLLAGLSHLHFAPTAGARANLLREGVAPDRIHVTGNTIVDALHTLLASSAVRCPIEPVAGRRLVVLTCHRRETFGPAMEAIFGAVRRLADRKEVQVVFPVHPNPHVQRCARRILGDVERVRLLDPLAYGEFIGLLRQADLVLSDSGGIQEEAPSLGVPVVVLREVTERPEGVEAGWSVLAGRDPERILAAATELLERARPGDRPAANPFGDGQAARRIAEILENEADSRE